MKRILTLLSVLALIVWLVACTNQPKEAYEYDAGNVMETPELVINIEPHVRDSVEFNVKIQESIRIGNSNICFLNSSDTILEKHPIMIRSYDEFTEYLSYDRGSEHLNRNMHHFFPYNKDFFEENFLVTFFMSMNGCTSYRVDAVHENGNVYMTRRVLRSEYAPDSFHIILYIIELSNSVTLEQINFVINTEYF